VERRGICPIAAVCTVVEVLVQKCFGYRPWSFKVTWRYRSREHSTCTVRFSDYVFYWHRPAILTCFRDTKTQIYPGRDLDFEDYVTSSVTWW